MTDRQVIIAGSAELVPEEEGIILPDGSKYVSDTDLEFDGVPDGQCEKCGSETVKSLGGLETCTKCGHDRRQR